MENDELKTALLAPCKGAFESVSKQHGRENVIGFGFHTCEGYPHVGIVAATKEGLAANPHCNESEFLFSTDEWNLMPTDDGAEAANDLLAKAYDFGEAHEDENVDWFDTYRDTFTSSCIEVLAELVDAGVFGSESERENLFLILGVSDSLISYTDGVEWSARLNTSAMHNRYASFSATAMKNWPS